jgi:hypothetical protein
MWTTGDTGIEPWKLTWILATDVSLQSNNNYYDTLSIALFNLFNNTNICILTLLLHMYDITSHYCIFLCCILPWRWLQKAEHIRRFTTCLYITLSSNSTAVGIYMAICLTAWNMDNFNYSYILNDRNLTSWCNVPLKI